MSMPGSLVIFIPAIDPGPDGGGIGGLIRGLLLINLLASLPVGLLSSLALFKIAKRWFLPMPWLAWIPGGNLWILGALSDEARRPRKLPRRYGMLVVALLTIGLLLADPAWLDGWLILPAFLATLLGLVFGFMTLSDVYEACRPDRTVLYTLATIFLPFAAPFCLLRCAFSKKYVA